jgi:solute carrier family 25 thiamine pyrophosphate transporter 19
MHVENENTQLTLAIVQDEKVLSASYKPTHDMISGALSGLFSKTIVYPFDLVRKRLQMEGAYKAEAAVAKEYIRQSWWNCIKHIIKEEGIRSLYKGLAPSLLKVGPANAVTFMVFEETKDALLWFKKVE